MSAPMRLTARDVDRLSEALAGLSKLAREHEVRFDPYGPMSLQVTNQTTVSVRWDENEGLGEYVVDDRNGS